MASVKQVNFQSFFLRQSPAIPHRIDSLARLEEGLYLASFSNDETFKTKITKAPDCLIHMHVDERLSHRSHIGDRMQIDTNQCHQVRINNSQPHLHSRGPLFKVSQKSICGCKHRILLPFVVVITFSCAYYAHSTSESLESLSNLPLSVDSDNFDNFDYVAFIFFCSLALFSIRNAYLHLNLGCKYRAAFSQGRASYILMHLKPVIKYLEGCNSGKKLLEKAASFTWTSGEKPQQEKIKGGQEGIEVYSNGDRYEGDFREGRYSGSGVYYYYMSGRYEGDWVDGKYDGFGVETWTNCSQYWGQFARGLREGYGVYCLYTGNIYAGEWLNGQSHGSGVQTSEDGSRFIGEFKWGVKHGVGRYLFGNGDVYAGEYFADKMHGYGVYQFKNGHKYEGSWHEGKRHGLGMYNFPSGDVQAGYWNGGTLGTSSTHNPTMGALVAEARRASARSYAVPYVDQRVNKAIATANCAASGAKMAALKALQKASSSASSPGI
ncbi:hypothetical protein KP509_14G087600 [Ceratopteris richardii]|uniref:Uncharacterized protein n=1 Tax=Ceratopteris richardii TaxID=49495 RepID=A0A8T2TE08_CERRI|nr:hypothetical protein KP509_14G087600 [Ceratopteris richardii]